MTSPSIKELFLLEQNFDCSLAIKSCFFKVWRSARKVSINSSVDHDTVCSVVLSVDSHCLYIKSSINFYWTFLLYIKLPSSRAVTQAAVRGWFIMCNSNYSLVVICCSPWVSVPQSLFSYFDVMSKCRHCVFQYDLL